MNTGKKFTHTHHPNGIRLIALKMRFRKTVTQKTSHPLTRIVNRSNFQNA